MKLLAIETSGKLCGACITEDDKIIDILEQENGLTHSESLMPIIDKLLKQNNIKIKEIDGFICDIGPGSFTGIRIGVATTKAFTDCSTNVKFSGVSSLEALAYNVNTDGIICSVIDCKNDNCYYAIYNLENSNYVEIIPPTAASIFEMIETIKKYNSITFVGDGVIIYKDKIIENIKGPKFSNNNKINTKNLAIAGYKIILENRELELLPMYLKKPQAERQLEEKKTKIDKMNSNDIDNISNILQKDFDDFWNVNILKQELINETSHLFVAKNIENNIVGFACIQYVLDEATITNIVTKKDFRHQGIGKSLLQHLISTSKQNNIKSLTLEVNENNTNAIKLYEKFKFKKVGLRKNYYNGNTNALLMTLYL